MKRIPELDGIRGVAIGLVLLYHFAVVPAVTVPGSFWAYLQAAGRLTWSGVDLFFVLSGFLIGGILIDARDSEDYYRTFYRRRFFRIVPLYIAVLAFIYIFAISTEHEAQPLPWWPHLLFLQNFWMAATGALGFFGVSWSLAIEEQFYLTLPSLIRFLRRDRLWYAVAVGIIAAPILRVAVLRGWPDNPLASTMLMPCRADALLVGVAGAMLLRNANWRFRIETHPRTLWLAIAVLAAGAAFLTIRQPTPHEPWRFSLQLSWLALLYAVLLMLATTQPRSWLGAVLRFTPLRRLGMIAYGVYLLHQSLFVAIEHALPFWPAPVKLAAGLAATIALALLSWRYFEKPLIDYSHTFTVPHFVGDGCSKRWQ